jgi:Nucleotidyltransferase domain
MNKAMPLPRTVPDDKRPVLAEGLDGLCAVRGVNAVALGGSYARGTQHPGSDIDLGLYYSESQPFVIEDIRQVATSPAVVTDFYEWGAWVNGGGTCRS